MAFLEGIAGYVERKGSKKRRHKTESGQRYSLNGLMTDLGLRNDCIKRDKPGWYARLVG